MTIQPFTAILAGVMPSSDAFYAAAKHGVIGLVRSLAPALACDGVTVNAFCPGFVDTPLIATSRDALDRAGLAIAAADRAADAVEAILADGSTGRAWELQADRPIVPLDFPYVPVSSRSPASPTR